MCEYICLHTTSLALQTHIRSTHSDVRIVCVKIQRQRHEQTYRVNQANKHKAVLHLMTLTCRIGRGQIVAKRQC